MNLIQNKDLFKKLKLLDSIGKDNPDSRVGSIRKGYIVKLNKSIDPVCNIKNHLHFINKSKSYSLFK